MTYRPALSLLVAAAALLSAGTAEAGMRSPLIFAGSTTAPSTSVNNYAPLTGGGAVVLFVPAAGTTPATIPAGQRNPVLVAGTVSHLRVYFPTTLLAGTSYTVTLVKNGDINGTALSVTVSDASTTAADLVTTVSVAAGDDLCWKISPSGTPAAQTAPIQISAVFEADAGADEDKGVLFSHVRAGALATNVIPGLAATAGSSETNSTGVMPCAGTISKMEVDLTTAPGSGKSRTFRLRQNGADAGDLLTIADTATTGSVTFGTPVTFAAGDMISLTMAVNNTPASSAVGIGLDWLPTVDGEYPLFGTALGAQANSATRYNNLNGQSGSTEATEANTLTLAPVDFTLGPMRAAISTAAGASPRSRTFTVRKGNGTQADTALSVVIGGTTDTTGTDADTVAVTGGDLLNVAAVPSATAPSAVTWNRVGVVAVLPASAPSLAFSIDEREPGYVWAGIRQASSLSYDVTWTGSPNTVEARVVDAGTGTALTGFDWATKIASPSGGAGTVTFSAVPTGGPYRVQVRDGAQTVTQNGSNDFYVGAKVIIWGQSQSAYLTGIGSGTVAATSGIKASVLVKSDKSTLGNAAVTRITGTPALGSGVVALANQWHADTGGVPLMIVDCTFGGTAIDNWIDDDNQASDAAVLTPLHLWSELADEMFDAADHEADAVAMFQGTSNANGGYASYGTSMDTLKGMFETALSGTASPLFVVLPHPRSQDGEDYTFPLRQVQYTKATSGGTYRLGAWLLDWQMDGDGSPHQLATATGNIRGGTRIGRGIAKALDDTSLDIAGPQIASCRFTDGTRNVIAITYDRDISLADGTAYAGSAVALVDGLFSVSTDSGSTFNAPASPAFSAEITAARVVTLTKDSGSWPEGTTRVDYLRGIPFSSDSNDTDEYVGAEADMETARLSKVLTDTSTFDGNRGMPASPVMGTGYAVAEFDAAPGGGNDGRPKLGIGLGIGIGSYKPNWQRFGQLYDVGA